MGLVKEQNLDDFILPSLLGFILHSSIIKVMCRFFVFLVIIQLLLVTNCQLG